jgi:ferrous iron transport protein B
VADRSAQTAGEPPYASGKASGRTVPLYTTTGQLTVALVGNPNTGKTSLFNALTGFRRHVANYPGVTVEVARGPVRNPNTRIELLDLPGTYSLSAVSPDEQLVTDVLAGRAAHQPKPDAILAIVDASNLRRNLYLVSQLLDYGLPLIVAVNMIDIARSRGIEVDCDSLSKRLGGPVIPVIATREATLAPLVAALARVPEMPPARRATTAAATTRDAQPESPADPTEVDIQTRYAWVGRLLDGTVTRSDQPIVTLSERLDRVLTHRVAGVAVLAVVLFGVFQSIFQFAAPFMDLIDAGFGLLGEFVASWTPAGIVRSLIVDGLIAGVGGVLVFLPQIVILFAVIAILEDCGYLARAAYMMDRLMRGLGLTGRAFIPMLSSFACAVPAIMGTRTIADRRERYTTILLAPFMSCSARLPVYVLFISAFVEPKSYFGGWVGLQGAVMLAMYLVGVLVVIPFAWLLRRTAFRGPTAGFVLELPSYKAPRPRAVLQRMVDAGTRFVVRAGTIILFVNMIVWALGYFPHSSATESRVAIEAQRQGWDDARFESELAGAHLRDSYLGAMGRWIEPVVKPIGWDWRLGMAALASFPAREVVIATLGTIYNLGADEAEESQSLQEALHAAKWPDTGEPVFSLPVALSVMVFFALCAQCAATLVTIGRETGSWAWPVVSFCVMTGTAYGAAWATARMAIAFGL